MSPKPKRGPGQPPKLTPEVLLSAVAARRRGLSLVDSVRAAGFSPRAHYVWTERGREDALSGKNSIYTEYMQRMEVASAQGVNWRIRRVEQIAGNPKASATDVSRARLYLDLQRMFVDARHMNRKLKLERRELELRAPTPPPAQEKPEEKVELRRLSHEDFTRYLELAAKLRADVQALAAEEFSELQGLLRKARGDTTEPELTTLAVDKPGQQS